MALALSSFYLRLAKCTGSSIIASHPCLEDGTVTHGGVNTAVGWAGTRKGTTRLAGQSPPVAVLLLVVTESPAAVTFEVTVLRDAAGTRPPVVVVGWVNQAYSRLSTTHGHITDCKLLVCMC